jgi:crotonobetainyl-CoA:carnitine CoA-transferase CaiB-like acyl-CoA transferase
MTDASEAKGPLDGIRVLDLSRILAAPTCTLLLGDLGADIIKIERPGRGDDTRAWGPPFVLDEEGHETRESAYYMCANRNKRSFAVDIATEDGQRLIRELARHCDVLVENFKVGDLKRRGLDYQTIAAINPRLIYCSVTGFGQTGPYAHRPGYDFLIQGMGGMMSLTGDPDEEGGRPLKVGVGIADVVCGLYSSNAILAALHHRHATGKGQHIDVALLDTQVSWLINQGVSYLTDRLEPPRRGNAHPTIVPYETFPGSDGEFIIATGNDAQYRRLCEVGGHPELADDPRFLTNKDRVLNRLVLIPLLGDMTRKQTCAWWIEALEKVGVPCGPVNNLEQVFADPQIVAREMEITMDHPASGTGVVNLIGNPLKMSETPVTYRHHPPMVGQHSTDVLRDILGCTDEEIATLEKGGVVDLGKDG